MLIGNQLVHNPQLSYQKRTLVGEKDYWELIVVVKVGGEDKTYGIKVSVYWDDNEWDHFTGFFFYEHGEKIFLRSEDETKADYENMKDYEGKEAADRWLRENPTQKMRGIEFDIKEALIRRWKALRELVSPHVTF